MDAGIGTAPGIAIADAGGAMAMGCGGGCIICGADVAMAGADDMTVAVDAFCIAGWNCCIGIPIGGAMLVGAPPVYNAIGTHRFDKACKVTPECSTSRQYSTTGIAKLRAGECEHRNRDSTAKLK